MMTIDLRVRFRTRGVSPWCHCNGCTMRGRGGSVKTRCRCFSAQKIHVGLDVVSILLYLSVLVVLPMTFWGESGLIANCHVYESAQTWWRLRQDSRRPVHVCPETFPSCTAPHPRLTYIQVHGADLIHTRALFSSTTCCCCCSMCHVMSHAMSG